MVVASNLAFSSIGMTCTRNGLEKNPVSGNCFQKGEEVLYSWPTLQGRLNSFTMAEGCELKIRLWM